jgi:hypothetical protein
MPSGMLAIRKAMKTRIQSIADATTRLQRGAATARYVPSAGL